MLSVQALAQPGAYPWAHKYDSTECIMHRIRPPEGCERMEMETGSFGDWLRHLPLKKGNPPVLLFDGTAKGNQSAHVAVIDMDVGGADLQQCADAVIRLRSEYLYSRKNYSRISFAFTSGDRAEFRTWVGGYRPVVRGNTVRWSHSAARDSSYHAFREYLNAVFTYSGSYSLSRECRPIDDRTDLSIGDLFVEGGFPGHAVIIVDMVMNRRTGKKLFLLAQSYMPAQEVHILVNNSEPDLSPWYEADSLQGELQTPEWTFPPHSAMRLR